MKLNSKGVCPAQLLFLMAGSQKGGLLHRVPLAAIGADVILHSVVEAIIAVAGLTAGLLVLLRVIAPSDAAAALRKAVFVAIIGVVMLYLVCCLIGQVVIPVLIESRNLLKSAALWAALVLFALIAITVARSLIAAINRKQKSERMPAREGGSHEQKHAKED